MVQRLLKASAMSTRIPGEERIPSNTSRGESQRHRVRKLFAGGEFHMDRKIAESCSFDHAQRARARMLNLSKWGVDGAVDGYHASTRAVPGLPRVSIVKF
jgi:hypothetical protein